MTSKFSWANFAAILPIEVTITALPYCAFFKFIDLKDLGRVSTSFAFVLDPAGANKTTSCPRVTKFSVIFDTTNSVPPYFAGGTDSENGETIAIFIRLRLI